MAHFSQQPNPSGAWIVCSHMGLSLVVVGALVASGQLPSGAVGISLGSPVSVGLASTPVVYHGDKLSIVSLGEATFVREDRRLSLIQNPSRGSSPGIYGMRWGQMPPTIETELPFSVSFAEGPWLRATVKAAVAQYGDCEYRVSCAVFDGKGRLLGTASHVEKVQYIRLGSMPTLFREIAFDFGPSKAFAGAKYAAFSINEPLVPVPPDGG